jgi:hypothetical protein
LTCPIESKPNSRMIKTNTIGVMPMASSIIDKKSPRRGRREKHRATDLRRRTRRKSPSLSLGRLDLSSWYYLKHSKIDISQNMKFLAKLLWRSGAASIFARADFVNVFVKRRMVRGPEKVAKVCRGGERRADGTQPGPPPGGSTSPIPPCLAMP